MVDEERGQLDAMIELLKLEVNDIVKRESPDFVITFGDGRQIGVEVVRALNEAVARGRGAVARIKRTLREALESTDTRAWVSVSLNENTASFLNGDSKALRAEVAAIAALARDVADRDCEAQWYNYEWVDHSYDELEDLVGHPVTYGRDPDVRDLKGTGVKHVEAIGIHPQKEPKVFVSGQGRGQHRRIVQEAIDSKCADLPTYRQCRADEIWLLVIGSAGTGGSLFVDDVEGVQFTSPYDRTVFLEQFEGRCVYLDTLPP
jgi:hypothetical protein